MFISSPEFDRVTGWTGFTVTPLSCVCAHAWTSLSGSSFVVLASASMVQEVSMDRKPIWGMDDVEARFLDAAHTAYRLPPVRVQGYNNPWMSLAMQTPSRYPDTERVYRPMSPSPEAIERMLETMKWVQWLEIDQRHLVWMRAKRYGWHQIGRRFACDRTTAWRRWQRALQTVADQLNALGVSQRKLEGIGEVDM